MAIAKIFPNNYNILTTNPSGQLSTPQYCYYDDSDATTAVAEAVFRNGYMRERDFVGFNTSSIPSGSTINSITAVVRWKTEYYVTSNMWFDIAVWNSTNTTRYGYNELSASSTTYVDQSCTINVSNYSNLSTLRIRFSDGTNTTYGRTWISYVCFVIDYSPPATNVSTTAEELTASVDIKVPAINAQRNLEVAVSLIDATASSSSPTLVVDAKTLALLYSASALMGTPVIITGLPVPILIAFEQGGKAYLSWTLGGG